jgi:uncharacterized protein (TIGR02284 family)
MASQDRVSVLNALLRGELAATETYQQAMAKVGNEPAAEDLGRIRDEHREAANTLRQHVHQQGGQPDQDSGAWGTFAKAVEGTAKLFGNAAALKALKEGEEHGLKSYEDALTDNRLPTELRTLIQSRLLPQTRTHVQALDRMLMMK